MDHFSMAAKAKINWSGIWEGVLLTRSNGENKINSETISCKENQARPGEIKNRNELTWGQKS